ncbi:PEP-CTERM sorting domain-containing protein [Geobacter sp. FeAm09]|uniref:PEP-CTERM sorting domain-containing protein n=1 Tax=Geobacter sp. FeAm09 TaxID=2597769 RepID=UPI001F104776|nr:PEP-CTERM sorting domain-containing protein [Geobacter sp. FeAm09]
MKKTFLAGLIAVGLTLAAMTGVASATSCTPENPCTPGTSYTWTDSINFGSTFNDSSDHVTANFNISPPFTPGVDTISSIQFFIEITDLAGSAADKVKLVVGSWNTTSGDIHDQLGWDWATNDLFTASLITDLAADGKLALSILWNHGNYILESAGIEATGCDMPGAPVPEPGTIALVGLGMVGLAIYGKRRQNNKA